jgi:hypothetical protein
MKMYNHMDRLCMGSAWMVASLCSKEKKKDPDLNPFRIQEII